MTTLMKPKFRSYNQRQLKEISDILCSDIEHTLESLGVEDYKIIDKMVTMSCPIHGGDNSSALNLYYVGDTYRGNWKCRTHQCEETFKSSIIGFIRGYLSKEQKDWEKPGDDTVSFAEAISVAEKIAKYDGKGIKVSKQHKEKFNFVNTVKNIAIEKPKSVGVERNFIKSNLEIPSKYFISRGFNKDILTKYDVGECTRTNRPMSSRAVVPVYDMDGDIMVGCSGRSIFDKCDKCSAYHNPTHNCPQKEKSWLYSKWKHSSDFKTQNYLYNMWYAKKYIKKTATVIIVESPGNVWKLEQAGIHNSVAVFGTNLADRQKMIIDISGAMNIITVMDSDDPGQAGAKKISDKCNRTYNVFNIKLSNNTDIGEMDIEDIKKEILPQVEKYYI